MNAHSSRIYFDEPPREDKVSMAVAPVDAFSGRMVTAGVKAVIDGLYDRPIRNLSGRLVFINLEERPQYVVRVDATEAGYILPPAFEFVPPALDDPDATAKRRHTVLLTPRPDFPFAEATTLIRGVLKRGTGPNAEVKDARVWIALDAPPPNAGAPAAFETWTDKRGAFVLPISLPPDKSEPIDVTVQVTIHFEKDSDARAFNCTVTDGKSHSFQDPIDLIGTNEPEFFNPYQP